MSNKKIIIVIGVILLALILLTRFYVILILLRLWPLWLFMLILAGLVFVLKRNNTPGTTGDYRELKTGFNGFLQKLADFLNSPSFNNLIRKLFLYPVLGIGLLVIVVVGMEFIFSGYFKMRGTKKEGIEISEALNKYKYHMKKYPADIQTLIGNNPLKKEWASDSWERSYQYHVSKDGQNFSLLSAGKDGKPGNEDDIRFDKHGELTNN